MEKAELKYQNLIKTRYDIKLNNETSETNATTTYYI